MITILLGSLLDDWVSKSHRLPCSRHAAILSIKINIEIITTTFHVALILVSFKNITTDLFIVKLSTIAPNILPITSQATNAM